MRNIILTACAFVALAAFAGTASASTRSYGDPVFVSEEKAYNLLERTYDHAYCTGIPRFGKQGSFPYERYRVFDCYGSVNSRYCDLRVKSVNYGYARFRLVNMRAPDCF